MSTSVSEGMLLWEPSEEMKRQSNLVRYMQWLEREKGLHFDSQAALWQWSVEHLEDFWASIWDYFQIQASKPYQAVLVERKMPGAQWFPGAELNYTEHVFRNKTAQRPALLFQSERQELMDVSWDELYRRVSDVARALRNMGVQRVDRFQQIEPKVLFAVDGYQYGGKTIDRRSIVAEIQQQLPTLQKTILVPYAFEDTSASSFTNAMLWQDIPSTDEPLTYEQVPFDHPLWVLYSSGTTGLPKAIVQGQGGILLEHVKSLHLGMNLKQDDRFFWYTTTGWMMWNFLMGGLLVGVPILLYDGSPAYPDMNILWSFAEKSGMTFFGTSAGYILSCMKAGVTQGKSFDLSRLWGLGSTGSPLPPEGFAWLYE